ncbi:hypothetical protein DCAR_0414782 [Daucus carota subsp. sativus]|uniref:Uncharacterized protein n=1 Tax=Daucus carota subsp. sativus TaxID=79200 RepID=A0A165A0M3_DAUCS|nr:hypothetical protein DCAR_0414782 [Daucus carota subsp. sativus]
MAPSYLADMTNETTQWEIKARICSLWKIVETENAVTSLEMLLMDEQPVPSTVMLLFLENTTIDILGDNVIQIPRYAFQFVNETTLRGRADDNTLLSDVVGCYLGGVEGEESSESNDKRVLTILTNFSVKTRVIVPTTVPGVSNLKLHSNCGPTHVIVVSSVIVNKDEDPAIQHVSSVRDRFMSLIGSMTNAQKLAHQLAPDNRLLQKQVSIEQFQKVATGGSLQGELIAVTGTIVWLDNEGGWYYNSCKACLGDVTLAASEKYHCNCCAQTFDHPLTLFRIVVDVQDTSGSLKLRLLNPVVEPFLDTSAKKILNRKEPGDDSIPEELMALLGKTFQFKIRVNTDKLLSSLQNYIVVQIKDVAETLRADWKNCLASEVPNQAHGLAQNAGLLPRINPGYGAAPAQAQGLTQAPNTFM